jgi:hypothetical protein
MDITAELIKRLKEDKEKIAETLVTGNIGDFNKYQRLVGRAEGIQIAIQSINDILTEQDHNDE